MQPKVKNFKFVKPKSLANQISRALGTGRFYPVIVKTTWVQGQATWVNYEELNSGF